MGKIPSLRRIQGQKDKTIRLLRDLQTRSGRDTHNAFVAAGPELSKRAFLYGGTPIALLFADGFANTDEALALRALAAEHRCPTLVATDGMLSKFLGKRPTPRCAAICPRPTADIQTLAQSGGVFLIAEDLENPDNLGMLLRSAEASGLCGVILTGEESCDPFTKRSVRGSRGAVFHLPIVEAPDTKELLDILHAEHVHIVGTSANTGVPHSSISYKEGTFALLVGNERVGLSETILEASTSVVCIPMRGKINSLNVSVAASIMMYEATRDRLPS